jgi:hypothetical protein
MLKKNNHLIFVVNIKKGKVFGYSNKRVIEIGGRLNLKSPIVVYIESK